jgi:acetyl-CoA carboxylase alpha subunit
MDRPQTQDIIEHLFDGFIELSGDGRVGRDVCIRGGLASFGGQVRVSVRARVRVGVIELSGDGRVV